MTRAHARAFLVCISRFDLVPTESRVARRGSLCARVPICASPRSAGARAAWLCRLAVGKLQVARPARRKLKRFPAARDGKNDRASLIANRDSQIREVVFAAFTQLRSKLASVGENGNIVRYDRSTLGT
jgi:hypothetical protein